MSVYLHGRDRGLLDVGRLWIKVKGLQVEKHLQIKPGGVASPFVRKALNGDRVIGDEMM
jgi:hypothetical protein